MKYLVYYSERLHVESAVYAGELIKQGAIGRVLQVSNLAPHRLNAPQDLIGFFRKKNTAGFYVILAAIKLSNSYLHREYRSGSSEKPSRELCFERVS